MAVLVGKVDQADMVDQPNMVGAADSRRVVGPVIASGMPSADQSAIYLAFMAAAEKVARGTI